MWWTTIAKRDGFMLAGLANINTFDTYRRWWCYSSGHRDPTILGVVTIEHVECYHKFRGKIEEKIKSCGGQTHTCAGRLLLREMVLCWQVKLI